jgi:oligopeptide/dipeptide ABC transporter ATP-binding protein
VAEAGDVELVVKHPLHPYTQLLIGSIPQVSTERDWLSETPRPAAEGVVGGCKFLARCPVSFDACRTAAPALFQTEPSRVASCYRHKDAGSLPPERLADVLGTHEARV